MSSFTANMQVSLLLSCFVFLSAVVSCRNTSVLNTAQLSKKSMVLRSEEQMLSLLIYSLNRMNRSLPADLVFLIADQWIPLPPNTSFNDVISGRESRNTAWRQKCDREVRQKISKCNHNETQCITLIPSENVYQFILGPVQDFASDSHLFPYLGMHRLCWYQCPALYSRSGIVVGRSLKTAILVDSEKMYFAMTRKSGNVVFRKSAQNINRTPSESDWVAIPDTDHDLVYNKVEIRWKVYGYAVRDICIFQTNHTRPLPSQCLWNLLCSTQECDKSVKAPNQSEVV